MFGREIEDIFVWVVNHWVQDVELRTSSKKRVGETRCKRTVFFILHKTIRHRTIRNVTWLFLVCITIVGELQDARLTQLFTHPSITIAKPIRTHFETRAEGSLHFWECPSKAEWFIHAEVHKKRLPGCATQPRNRCKLHTTCWGGKKARNV